MDDVMKIRKHLGCFINEQKIAFVPLYCDRNMNDVISTGKILENTWLRLVLSLGIFPVEITSFMFLTRRHLSNFPSVNHENYKHFGAQPLHHTLSYPFSVRPQLFDFTLAKDPGKRLQHLLQHSSDFVEIRC